MKDQLVLRIVTKLTLPFIIMFGLYIQFHGEVSPGGGFQAGIVLAAALVLYALIYGTEAALKVFPLPAIRVCAALGVLLYGGVGLAAMLLGGRYLEYSVLAGEMAHGQERGIFWVEIGVGLTVCAVMLLIFFTFAARKR